MGNFVTGVRESKADAARIWELLADVGAWPDNFTPHLKEAHLDGELRVGATGWVKTTLPLHKKIFADADFQAGDIDTTYLDSRLKELGLQQEGSELEAVAIAAALTDYLSLRREGSEHQNQWKQRARLASLRGEL